MKENKKCVKPYSIICEQRSDDVGRQNMSPGRNENTITADYWKSQAKKFCDFCKCWIADNKPGIVKNSLKGAGLPSRHAAVKERLSEDHRLYCLAFAEDNMDYDCRNVIISDESVFCSANDGLVQSIDFHEKGKRHKENVTQRLKDIGKKSAKEHKEMLSVDEEMKKMEQAALRAYMKDVEADADFTSQVIKQQIAEKQKKAAVEEAATLAEKASERVDSDTKEDDPESRPQKPTKMWYEAESEQGYTYYWHTETGESMWEPPGEGYMSLAVQREAEEEELKQQAKEEKKALRKKAEEERQKKEEVKLKQEEERARLEREKMCSRRVKEEKEEKNEKSEVSEAVPVVGPAPRFDPYGGWKAVETRVQEPIDLQLPHQEFVEIKVPSVNEPKVKFKEKTIARLGEDCGTSSSFKRRKGSSIPKRNMRQRLDDD